MSPRGADVSGGSSVPTACLRWNVSIALECSAKPRNARARSQAGNSNGSPSPVHWPSNRCLIVADEPVASLDPNSAGGVMGLIRSSAHTDGLAVICSLHQVNFARTYADRIIGLSHGRVVFAAPTEKFDQAAYANLHDMRTGAPASGQSQCDQSVRSPTN